MWLKQSQVAHYLVSLGLVNPRAVVEEDLVITEVSRRNTVYLVTSSEAEAYVVKQGAAATAAALANEAAVCGALAGAPELRGVVPELAHHDPSAARLVLRSPAGAQAMSANGRMVPRAIG